MLSTVNYDALILIFPVYSGDMDRGILKVPQFLRLNLILPAIIIIIIIIIIMIIIITHIALPQERKKSQPE